MPKYPAIRTLEVNLLSTFSYKSRYSSDNTNANQFKLTFHSQADRDNFCKLFSVNDETPRYGNELGQSFGRSANPNWRYRASKPRENDWMNRFTSEPALTAFIECFHLERDYSQDRDLDFCWQRSNLENLLKYISKELTLPETFSINYRVPGGHQQASVSRPVKSMNPKAMSESSFFLSRHFSESDFQLLKDTILLKVPDIDDESALETIPRNEMNFLCNQCGDYLDAVELHFYNLDNTPVSDDGLSKERAWELNAEIFSVYRYLKKNLLLLEMHREFTDRKEAMAKREPAKVKEDATAKKRKASSSSGTHFFASQIAGSPAATTTTSSAIVTKKFS